VRSKAKRIAVNALLFLVVSALGTGLGFWAGNLLAMLVNQGTFVSWAVLPSSLRFEKILDADTQAVWARSTDGATYSWDQNCDRQIACGQWAPRTPVPPEAHGGSELPVKIAKSCKFDEREDKLEPPGEVVECARGMFSFADAGSVAYYALMDDGTIWRWHLAGSTIADLYMVFCATTGGFVGAQILFIALMARRKVNERLVIATGH